MISEKKSAKNLSVIVYEAKKSPKYFEINKSMVRFLFITLPLTSLISVLSLVFILMYFNHLLDTEKAKEPRIIAELKQINGNTLKKYKEALVFSNQLQDKLASKDLPQLNAMNLFRSVPGQKIATTPASFAIENLKTNLLNDRYAVKFNLVNITEPKKRIAGHIFVMAKTNNSIHFYPKDIMSPQKMLINFNKGESFVSSRFRPVNATFNIFGPKRKNDPKSKILIKVLVFSRQGDILHDQIIETTIPHLTAGA